MSARCIPRHMVSYRGGFYQAEEPFEIDPADIEEMAQYGEIEQTEPLLEDSPEEGPVEDPPEDGPPIEEEPGFSELPEIPLPKRRRRS